MFEEERPLLQALPSQGMQYFTESQRTVCDDSRVRVDHSSYAARPAPIGTLQGHDVRYVEADTEFARFALSTPQEQAGLMRAYVEPDLLVLDDLFLARHISDASRSTCSTTRSVWTACSPISPTRRWRLGPSICAKSVRGNDPWAGRRDGIALTGRMHPHRGGDRPLAGQPIGDPGWQAATHRSLWRFSGRLAGPPSSCPSANAARNQCW
jgi:hypothetical protein